jgi:hypothetical protein
MAQNRENRHGIQVGLCVSAAQSQVRPGQKESAEFFGARNWPRSRELGDDAWHRQSAFHSQRLQARIRRITPSDSRLRMSA